MSVESFTMFYTKNMVLGPEGVDQALKKGPVPAWWKV